MKTDDFVEEMLVITSNYLVQEGKVGRSFMAKNPKLKRIWLD